MTTDTTHPDKELQGVPLVMGLDIWGRFSSVKKSVNISSVCVTPKADFCQDTTYEDCKNSSGCKDIYYSINEESNKATLSNSKKTFLKLSYSAGENFQIEEIRNLDEIPKTLLDELSGSFTYRYGLYDLGNIVYYHLNRDVKSVSTFWEEKAARDSTLPLSRLGSVVVYIPKEEYFVLYGGYIPKASGYEKRCTKHMHEIWYYHVKSNTWESVLSEHKSCGLRKLKSGPNGPTIRVFHHVKREKIFLLVQRSYPELFEFDYHSGKIKKICMLEGFKIGFKSVKGAIDYSNDTLVLCTEAKSGSFNPTPQKLSVFCFETYHRIEVNLKGWSDIYKEVPYSDITSWDMLFINDFKKLIFIPTNGCPTFAPFLDWVAFKQEFINPTLEQRKSLFRKRGY